MKRTLCSIILTINSLLAFGFEKTGTGEAALYPKCTDATWTDSILPLRDFLKIVEQNHPLSKQANLYVREAQASLLSARGGFDPKLYGDYEQKHFNKKNYFAFGEYGVKVPTWYGIELKGAYSTAQGNFIDPSDALPANGQAIFGVSFPLLQGLLMDDRRANLFKAQQAQGLNTMERNALLNNLAFEATTQYWKWAFAYQQKEVFRQALVVAQQRFRLIRTAYELGDRMAMDTLESATQVQDRELQYNETLIEYQEASLKLANFLWNNQQKPQTLFENQNPEFPSDLSPLSMSTAERDLLIGNLLTTHPLLRTYEYKLSQLDIDRRLKREKLKPKLNLNYNFLGNGFQINNVFADNYKWGVQFSSSSLFRMERGDMQLNAIKVENTKLLRDQKTLELQNKLQLAFQETENLQAQIRIYTEGVANFQKLLNLEIRRFELGESSFFLINSRESKYLEAQVKLAKLRASYLIAQASIDWAAGRLGF
jgi:outer membrane protein TolC